MKRIEISDEMYDSLVELATEMTEQDPRCTRMPHLFQIRDWQRNYDWNLNGNTHCWIYSDGDFTVVETLENFKDLLKYLDIDEPQNLSELWEDLSDLQEWIDDNVDGLMECSYSMEPVYKNAFLTAKAAQEHLDTNSYHYHQNADVYLSHSWRNPEAEIVTEFLLSLINKEPHK